MHGDIMKMFDLIIVTSTVQHQNKQTKVKLCVKVHFFFGRDMCGAVILCALNLLVAFLQRPFT